MASGRRFLRSLVVVLLAIPLLAAGSSGFSGEADALSGQADPSGQPAPVLFLRGDDEGTGSYHNFTASPPGEGSPVLVEPCRVLQEGRAEWCWQMSRSPEAWTLKAGAQAEAVVHLDGLDRVPVGTGDLDHPEQSGKLRLDVVLTRGSADEVAHGTLHIEPPATSGQQSMQATVPLYVPEDAHWNTVPGDAPAVELQIHLTGLVRRDLPPQVATSAVQADTHVVLPGFPMEGFLEWEDRERLERDCQARLLQQETCSQGEEPAAQREDVAEAPAWGLLPMLLLAFASTIAWSRLRRASA